MMQEQDLQELAELVSEGGSVLSLYLHIDPQRRSTDESKLSLRRLLAQAAEQGASRPMSNASSASSSTNTTGRAAPWRSLAARRGNSGGATRCWCRSEHLLCWTAALYQTAERPVGQLRTLRRHHGGSRGRSPLRLSPGCAGRLGRHAGRGSQAPQTGRLGGAEAPALRGSGGPAQPEGSGGVGGDT